MSAIYQHKLYEHAHDIEAAFHPVLPLVPLCVNMNGTSQGELIDQQRQIMGDLDNLAEAYAQANPHGRDFQTLDGGDQLAQIARRAWQQRRVLVDLLKQEIEIYADAIQKQGRR